MSFLLRLGLDWDLEASQTSRSSRLRRSPWSEQSVSGSEKMSREDFLRRLRWLDEVPAPGPLKARMSSMLGLLMLLLL